jgi:hypothetical protein
MDLSNVRRRCDLINRRYGTISPSRKQSATHAPALLSTASLSGNTAGEIAGMIEDDIDERVKKDTFLPPLAKRMDAQQMQSTLSLTITKMTDPL